MPKLFVSHDAGISYDEFMQADSVDKLLARTEKRSDPLEDISWCRWYIEDDDGNLDMKNISPIHKRMLILMDAINRKNLEEEEKARKKKEK